jgi:hypothetical protein
MKVSNLIVIKLISLYRPSEEEFMNPINYIEKLYKEGASEFGCIKIIPPSSYKPPNPMSKSSDKKMPTKYQILQDLSQAQVRFSYNL